MNKRQKKKYIKKVRERIDATMQYTIPLGRRNGKTESMKVFCNIVFSNSYKPYKQFVRQAKNCRLDLKIANYLRRNEI